MRLETLDVNSSIEEVTAAIVEVAGYPRSTHRAFLEVIVEKTERDPGATNLVLQKALAARDKTKHARLKLKSLIQSKGIQGRNLEGGIEIDDPLCPGEKIIVRDACLLGFRPLVEKLRGYARPLDDYIVALIGDEDIKPFMISIVDVKKIARQLENCDSAKRLSPSLLSRPNIVAFEEALKGGDHKALLVTLRMNQHYSIVENQGQIVIFANESREAYTRKEFEAKIASEFEDMGGDKPAPRYKVWFHHPARAHYEGIVFAPKGRDGHGRMKHLDRHFNLWTDFAQIGVKGDCSLLKKHIKEILCAGDEAAYEYLMNWLAHMFQKPWEKPGVAIVVWGKKRTGKGTVTDAIREAVGRDLSRMFNKKEQLIGRFSCSSQPLLFNQSEEAIFGKDPSEEGPLKSLITDPTENIELKFKTPYEVLSVGRYWFNANYNTPVPMTYDEERYFVLQISDAKANDHEYFAAIRKQLYYEGGLAALVEELCNRDITSFEVRNPPVTKHRAPMVLAALGSQDRAIADILIDGELTLLDNKAGEGYAIQRELSLSTATWVDKEDVRQVLNHAFKRYGAKEASASDITDALWDLGIIDGKRNAHKARNNQRAGYRFVPLAVARANFAKARNIPVELLLNERESFSPLDELEEHLCGISRLIIEHKEAFANPISMKAALAALQSSATADRQNARSKRDSSLASSLH